MPHAYRPAVGRLLRLGRPGHATVETSEALELGPEDVPDLIRLATDLALRNQDSDGPEVWAPVHAWHALGRLGPSAAAAAEPLTAVLAQGGGEDDWIYEALPKALGSLGPAALEPLARLLHDPSGEHWARVSSTTALSKLGQDFPECRAACIAALSAELEKTELDRTQSDVNGSAVSALVRLQAVEAAPALERAFGEGIIPTGICGDWDSVQVAFGLKEPPPSPPPRAFPSLGFAPPPEPEISGGFRDSRAVRKRSEAEKRKKKLAKASRRKNRR